MGLENHIEYRWHRENSNSMRPPRPLWLTFFAIIRVHPEKNSPPEHRKSIYPMRFL